MTRLRHGETHKVKTITLRVDELEFIQVALASFTRVKVYDNLNNRMVASTINKEIHKVLL